MKEATNKSRWSIELEDNIPFPKLEKDLNTEVTIVGGGISGLVAAYFLSKAGKKIVLLEKETLVSGETAYTTAFITQVYDTYLQDAVKSLGKEVATDLWNAGIDAIRKIEEIVKTENIDCDFERLSAIIFAPDQKGYEILEKEAEIAKELGFETELKKEQLSFSSYGYIEVKNQAKFDPAKFLKGLINVLMKSGVEIYENTFVEKINNVPLKVSTKDGYSVISEEIILSTHIPIINDPSIFNRVVSYQSYVIEAEVENLHIDNKLYWNTNDPYDYFRIDGNKIILGGQDHKTGEEIKNDPHKNIENYLKDNLKINNYKILNTWSGQIIETVDGLPIIGKTIANKNILMSTGYAGNGMTFSVVSAMINTDIILTKENKYEKTFDIKRFNGIKNILENGATFIKSFLHSGEEGSTEDIKNNSGKVLKEDGKAVAVFKDKDGKIHKMSAKCTHLGCTVGWNESQKSWDCPCHGSRFDSQGKVLNGPARKDLDKVYDC